MLQQDLTPKALISMRSKEVQVLNNGVLQKLEDSCCTVRSVTLGALGV